MERDWAAEVFDEDYVRLWSFPGERDTAAEVMALRTWLPAPPASVLDVACGMGRHSLALSRLGYDVVGIDTTSVFLDRALRAAAAENLSVVFQQMDMRKLYFAGFDASVVLGNSFGYHADDVNLQTLTRIVAATVSGGCVVVELLNRDRIVSNFRKNGEHVASDGTHVALTSDFDGVTGHLTVDHRWTNPQGHEEARRTVQRLYSVDEIHDLWRAVGLMSVELFDGFSIRPFNRASRRAVVVAARA